MFEPLRSPRDVALQDVAEPNLLRPLFPYTAIPRIAFDGAEVPLAPAPELWITDTTFRDGQQAREPYTVDQIVHIYDLLHQLDRGSGVIRQCEFFVYTEKDREAVRRCRELGYCYPEITAWIRAVQEDFHLVQELELAETGILTSVSDYHIFHKLGRNRRDVLAMYLEVVQAALEAGVRPRCHFEDLTRADVYGFAVPFAVELMRLSAQAGMPIKIRLCDTMGVGLPWPAAALPRGVPKLVRALVDDAGVPPAQLEWHGHNDLHRAHANAVTAWLYGCAAINSTLLSTGERTGNSPLEAAVVDYIGLTGRDDALDTRLLTTIASYMRDECGVPVPANYPLAGADFNVTRAGVHIDGLLKDPDIYNLFDTERLLGRPIGITVTDKSGVAGVAYWVNSYLGLAEDERLPKRHPGLERMYAEIVAHFEAGRTTHMTHDELLKLARRHLPEHFPESIRRAM